MKTTVSITGLLLIFGLLTSTGCIPGANQTKTANNNGKTQCENCQCGEPSRNDAFQSIVNQEVQEKKHFNSSNSLLSEGLRKRLHLNDSDQSNEPIIGDFTAAEKRELLSILRSAPLPVMP